MHFLVLGTGYVGKALLKKPFCELTATTTSKENLTAIDSLGASSLLLKGEEITEETLAPFDGVIILVAPKEGSLESYQKTYLSTAKQIQKALQGRTKPFYLLQASSTGAYGQTERGKLLREAENLYKEASSSCISVCILRLGGIFGPGRELTKRAQSLSGKTLPGTGLEPTNHIHVDDIVSAIAFCIKKSLTGTFALVNDDHRDRKTLYESLCSSLNIPPPDFSEKKLEGHGCNQALSNDPIKQAGFVFTYPLCYLTGE